MLETIKAGLYVLQDHEKYQRRRLAIRNHAANLRKVRTALVDGGIRLAAITAEAVKEGDLIKAAGRSLAFEAILEACNEVRREELITETAGRVLNWGGPGSI